jgi:hypothetical protein
MGKKATVRLSSRLPVGYLPESSFVWYDFALAAHEPGSRGSMSVPNCAVLLRVRMLEYKLNNNSVQLNCIAIQLSSLHHNFDPSIVQL